MSTSGTIGNTVISTDKLLEHALRRCGYNVAMQTPEVVSTARENLFMLMLSLSSRGINLWCVDKQILTLTQGKPTYETPVGTIDILNVVYATPTRVTPTSFTLGVADFTTDQTVVRVGVTLNAQASVVVQSSADGVTWGDASASVTCGSSRVWIDVSAQAAARYWKINTSANVTDAYFASAVREIAVTQFNRDDYTNQPNKNYQNAPITNFYYEKLINPRLTFWPVPLNGDDHIVIWRHRQVQDIGTLTNEVEIPNRWYEAVCWQLSSRCAFELPGVDPARRSEVVNMASAMLIEAENNETDHAPIRLAPNISVYTQ